MSTFSTETIIPVRGCSPVGSTQVNLGPKSLNTDLAQRQLILISDQDKKGRLPKEPAGLC